MSTFPPIQYRRIGVTPAVPLHNCPRNLFADPEHLPALFLPHYSVVPATSRSILLDSSQFLASRRGFNPSPPLTLIVPLRRNNIRLPPACVGSLHARETAIVDLHCHQIVGHVAERESDIGLVTLCKAALLPPSFLSRGPQTSKLTHRVRPRRLEEEGNYITVIKVRILTETPINPKKSHHHRYLFQRNTSASPLPSTSPTGVNTNITRASVAPGLRGTFLNYHKAEKSGRNSN